jgi:hypothetical protein
MLLKKSMAQTAKEKTIPGTVALAMKVIPRACVLRPGDDPQVEQEDIHEISATVAIGALAVPIGSL